MRLFRKTLIYLGIALISIVILLILLAEYAEKPISKLAIKQINQTLGTELEIGNIEFSLLKDFPNAQLQLQNVKLKSDSVGLADILLLKNLYIEVEMMPLLDNKINIIEIRLEDGEANYQVYANTKSNIDFLIPPDSEEEVSDTSSTQIDLTAPLIKTTGVKLFYKDEAENITATVILDAVSSVFMKVETGLSANAKGEVSIEKVNYPDTKAYLMEQTKMNVDVNFRNDTAYLNKAELLSDGIKINASGWIGIVDNYPADLKITNSQFNLKELSKYIPDSLINDYKLTISDGILSADALISGDLLDSVVLPKISASIGLQELAITALDYPAIKKLNTNITFSNGDERTMASSQVDIKDLLLATNKSSIKAKASVRNFDSPQYTFSSQADILLDEFSYLIPADLKTKMSGRVKANISNSGSVPDSVTMSYINDALDRSSAQIWLSNLSVKMDSVIELQNMNGTVSFENKNISAKNISCQLPEFKLDIKPSTIKGKYIGSIANIDQLGVKIDTFNLNTNNSSLIGSAYVKNGKKPYYQTSATTHINLKDWGAFIPDSLLSDYSGELSASIQSSGSINLDSISDEAMRLLFRESSTKISFSNLSLTMPDSLMCINNFNGQIDLQNDTIHINNFNGNYLSLKIKADSTMITNAYQAAILNTNKELNINGIFFVDQIDFSWIEGFIPKEDTVLVASTSPLMTEEVSEPINFTYKVNGLFRANSFKYGKTIFSNINSKFLVKENYYVANNLKMDAFGGTSLSSLKVEMLPDDEIEMFFNTNIQKMDVSNMIENFEEYVDYEDLNSENIKGLISSTMDGKIVLKNYEPVYESMLLNGDLLLENGALINVKPVIEIGKIPGIGLKNLDKLYFSTLKSNIFLFRNDLYIPQTEIRTTSFDAMFLGMYSFGEDYAYHIRMFLGEILSSKSKSNLKKQQQEEFDETEDEKALTKGRTSLYVVSKSENGKEKAGLDNKKDRANMRARVKLQKQMVDMRFHPTLVNYNTED
nr:AsmA family protein [uncultured Carboxylicivirga sp.]